VCCDASSTGENKVGTRRTKAREKAKFDVEKWDVAFSKSIVEISKKQKDQKRIPAPCKFECEEMKH